MAEEHTRIRQIAWMELFPWLGLVRAVRLAFAPRMLILAALGLVCTMAGWQACGWFSSKIDDAATKDRIADHSSLPINRFEKDPPPRTLGMLDPFNSPAKIPWNDLSEPFRELFVGKVTLSSFTFMLLCGIWAL